MIGKTGSGKSATGNTIMTKADHFESKLSGGSVTVRCKRGDSSQTGRNIVVIDTPGLFDTKTPPDKLSKEIITCINMSTPGPHVFLLIVQIARFTDEEIETFNRLFDLFGEEMGRFAIITFTKLDDLERSKSTIESYIEDAPEKMKEFLKRCHGRYIAFDNNATEENKAAKVRSLIRLVDSIVQTNLGNFYTNRMYKDAEATLQKKIKVVEEEKELEKKKEIGRIESTFVNRIDSIQRENSKLAQQVSSKETLQRQIQRDKENAHQEIQRMKEEMEKLDKIRNEEIYRIKEKEKEEKEKQAHALEERERQQMQLLLTIQQQQKEMDRKYQEMEQLKELQMSEAEENYNKTMATEIQRIVDGNNQKHDEMMKVLEAKDRSHQILQEKMEQQTASMQKQMHEREKEFLRQQEENKKRIMEEKEKAEENLRNHLANEQTKNNQIQTEAIEKAIKLQNSTMQEKLLAKEKQFLSKQDEQKKLMDAKTDEILKKQRERDERQRKDFEELKRQNEIMQEQLKKDGCVLS